MNPPNSPATVRSERLRQHRTLDEIAEGIGINRVSVSRIETGEIIPLPATIEAILGALGVTGPLPDVYVRTSPQPLTIEDALMIVAAGKKYGR